MQCVSAITPLYFYEGKTHELQILLTKQKQNHVPLTCFFHKGIHKLKFLIIYKYPNEHLT